jgi:hypothetical protein
LSGWGGFAFCVLSGGAYGISLGKESNREREIENVQLKLKMNEELRKIAEKRAEQGKGAGIFGKGSEDKFGLNKKNDETFSQNSAVTSPSSYLITSVDVGANRAKLS